MQIRARLAQEVADGAFYEAQQTYKSTFVRLKSKGDMSNAVNIVKVRRGISPPCSLVHTKRLGAVLAPQLAVVH